ncbi:hypothetical protein EDF70_102503 [Neorhizobium sp. JUb45]|nr:hypothetical protein EDF70_102503 [Neorhizobium sp. JUb45]
MEDVAARIAFSLLVGIFAFFAATNIFLTVLRITHRRDLADRLSAKLAPYTRYFRLGDSSGSGSGGRAR